VRAERAELLARLRHRARAAARAGDLETVNACECAALAGSRRFLGMLITPGATPLTLWAVRDRVSARDLKGARVPVAILAGGIEMLRNHPYFLSAGAALKRIVREVDGNHSLGAAALAEKIVERLGKPSTPMPTPAPPAAVSKGDQSSCEQEAPED
jgi:hypothetical protein